MQFPKPLDVHGNLLKLTDDAPTEIYETSKPFKVGQFIQLLKQLLTSWKCLKSFKSQQDFDVKVQQAVSSLVKYFGEYADDACESEVACYLEEFMFEQFQLKLQEEQWEVALWSIEAFYRMQAGDYSINELFKDVIVYPFLQDKIKFQEKSQLLQTNETIENNKELIAEVQDDELSQCMISESQSGSQSSVSSFDDGIYEY